MAATMKDIAKATGLGVATVSAYVNGRKVRDENAAMIQKAIDDLGFEINVVARGLKTKKTKTIGIVIPELSNVFCTSIITVIEDILRNHGYAISICDCRSDGKREKEAIDFLLKKMVDGLIIMPMSETANIFEDILKKEKPLVFIDRKIENINCDTILVDNVFASQSAVTELINNGHKKIGIICGPQNISTARERLLGYKQAFFNAGLELDSSFICYGDYTIDSGKECIKDLITKQKPTAVFVTNYEMTLGTIIALNEMNIKIPDDISVIGFDNIDFAKAINPNLTIITQPVEQIGVNAADLMLKRLNEPFNTDYKDVVLKTNLYKGKSVKKI